MSVILNVKSVGFLQNLKDDKRSPESFAFPACLCSLMEYIGEDIQQHTIQGHGREWIKRGMNDAILAASGMGFGLLWHRDRCPSSFDLMLVNDHNTSIEYAFDYLGYDCNILESKHVSFEEMKAAIIKSLDANRPVLAFGIVGPPECAIICGYEDEGNTLLGWSHFQSDDPADCSDKGMFQISGWYEGLWKIVVCGDKKKPNTSLRDIIRRGVSITQAEELNGYLSGAAAYEAWQNHIISPDYDKMNDEQLRSHFWFHNVLVGSHAEARCYLGSFLREAAGNDKALHLASDLYSQIHDTCWEIWAATDGWENPDAFKALRNSEKRKKTVMLIEKIQALDASASEELKNSLAQ